MQEPLPTATARQGLTGSTIKWLAMVLMVMDHIGAFVLEPYILVQQDPAEWLRTCDQVLRVVGRLAFPLFCFLLVEGYFHTHDRRKYLLQMVIFALLSEPVFDYANYSVWFTLEGQSIFWTLALGLLTIWGLDTFTAKGQPLLGWLGVVLFGATAYLCKTDYSFFGVVLILTFYLCRGKKSLYIAVPAVLFCGQFLAWSILFYDYYIDMGTEFLSMVFMSSVREALGGLSLLFIARYNGQRGGKMPKYFFYAFYPCHLLLLVGLRFLLFGL